MSLLIPDQTSSSAKAIHSLLGEDRTVAAPLNVELNAVDRSTIIALVDVRTLVRECMKRSMQPLLGCHVECFDRVQDCADRLREVKVLAILISDATKSVEATCTQIVETLAAHPGAPVIVVSDSEEPAKILTYLAHGARGFLTTNLIIDVAVEAIRLVSVGGTYVPASSLMETRKAAAAAVPAPSLLDTCNFFTARQVAVVEALRRGKANKIIAFELNMRESTVKVHVRNIMRKLNASNRTEVAYKAGELLGMVTNGDSA